MGYEDDRLAEVADERAKLGANLFAGRRVEGPERLVHQDERRICGERPSDANTLALAAGELGGIARREAVRIEPDQPQHLANAIGDALGGPAEKRRHEGDVSRHVEVRKEAPLLDDVASATAKLDRIPRRRRFAGDAHLAAAREEEGVDEPQGGGLARSAAPEQDHDLAGFDREIEIFDAGRQPPLDERDALEFHLHAAHCGAILTHVFLRRKQLSPLCHLPRVVGIRSLAAMGSRGAARWRESDRPAPDDRFSIERVFDSQRDSTLAEDVRRGLGGRRKSVPPKHFYDEEGSRLFDRICELPEYYLTRSEEQLLERSAREILDVARPTDLIELGSGAARKTRLLFDAAESLGIAPRYHPLDVCEPMLRASGEELLQRYPWLEVHALVADYERHLDVLPDGDRRLVAFLGSTIGNFAPPRALAFLRGIAARLRAGDHLLLGADLVKPVAVLERAYDDAAGVTAEFNRNVLTGHQSRARR